MHCNKNKCIFRSLEPLTGLAMWSSDPQIIELVKGERGLGFSILDYQVNFNCFTKNCKRISNLWNICVCIRIHWMPTIR